MRAHTRQHTLAIASALLLLAAGTLAQAEESPFAKVAGPSKWDARGPNFVRVREFPQPPATTLGQLLDQRAQVFEIPDQGTLRIAWIDEPLRELLVTSLRSERQAYARSALSHRLDGTTAFLATTPTSINLDPQKAFQLEEFGRKRLSADAVTGDTLPFAQWREVLSDRNVYIVTFKNPPEGAYSAKGWMGVVCDVGRAARTLYWVNDYLGFLQARRAITPNDREVLYNLALAYQGSNKSSEARTILADLVKQFPNSPFTAKVQGDQFTSEGATDSAEAAYLRAIDQQYEYVEAWEQLVRIKPQYYFNLGSLYLDKAKAVGTREDLYQSAKVYFEQYLAKLPTGPSAGDVQNKLAQANDGIHSFNREVQAEQRRIREEQASAENSRIRAEEESAFRTDTPYFVGAGFKFESLSGTFAFNKADHRVFAGHVRQDADSVALSRLVNNVTGFEISAGRFFDRFVVMGAINFAGGKANGYVDTVFTDSNTVSHNIAYHTLNITDVSQFEITATGGYNWLYVNPFLSYVGVGLTYGSWSPTIVSQDVPQDYVSQSYLGVHLEEALVWKVKPFLVELMLQEVFVGGSKGFTGGIRVHYNFGR